MRMTQLLSASAKRDLLVVVVSGEFISKTKDMITDFGRHAHKVTHIKGQTVKCVQSYQYLRTIIRSKLDFEANSEAVCKKGPQHLFEEAAPFPH